MELASLLNLMAQGQLQIPRFQREFVWAITKTRSLLDSMYKEYPIGTFFFWLAPNENADLFREMSELNIPRPGPGQPVSFILDGQQRLTSLFVTINGLQVGSRDYGRICIDLEQAARYEKGELEDAGENEEEARIFVNRPPDNQRWIAVRDLLRNDNYSIYDTVPADWRPVFQKAINRFHTYPLSVIWVKDQGLDDVVDIFQRINQGGKRLSRYDLVCANLWEPAFDFRSEVTTFNESLAQQGFGPIDGTVITQAFSLAINDSCTTPAELKMETSDVRQRWDDVISSLRLAVDFVKANFGVARYELLPYRGTLPVLAYFFYHAPKSSISAKQRQVLWEWFWRVTLSERYGTTSPSRMAEDAKELRRLHKNERVNFDYVSTAAPDAVARTTMTATSSALRNAVLCLLAMQRPRNFKDGSPISLENDFFSDLKKPERHHIFPNAFLRERGVNARSVHLVANFCFIPSDLNKEISAKAPSDYLESYQTSNPHFVQNIATHLVPIDADSPIWVNDFYEFVRVRSNLLAKRLNALIQDGPTVPLVVPDVSQRGKDSEIVTEIELRLRDLIDSHLTAVAGARYWNQAIPGEVKNKAKERIKLHIDKHPYESWEDYPPGRSRLDKVDVGDYEEIIRFNYSNFQSIFGQKNAFQQHMAAFREMRNAVAHNTKLNHVQRKLSDAAVAWLHQTLDRYDQRMRSESFVVENGTFEEPE